MILKKLLLALGVIIVLIVIALQQLGVFAVFFPSHQHEVDPPVLPEMQASSTVLLFTKTNSFRHVDGIEAGVELMKTLATKNAWQIFHTENGAVFNPQQLAKFKAVIFLNSSGDNLSIDQQRAFQHWLENGGGWLGVHAAGDGSHKDWPWYLENLIGADFTAHIMGPQFQQAKMINENPDHPVMGDLKGHWLHTEEWYSWAQSPRGKGFDILAVVDEDSYQPYVKIFGSETDLRMGDHPVVWSRCVKQGRAIYSALGHGAEAYQAAEHQALLESAVNWILAPQKPECR